MRRLVAIRRKIGGRVHRLSDHSLDKITAKRVAVRHRALGMNAKVIQHANGKYAVYRSCNLRRKTESTGNVKRIHINQAMMGFNRKNPNNVKPPITIQTSKGSIRATNIDIEGDSKLVYNNDAPLSCGARLWIETNGKIKIDNCTRMG